MATAAKENYLKALYHLHLKSPEISLTELGQTLDLRMPTVNSMVKKFHESGWVEYEKYKPVKLTEKGRKMAALVIRKHRLSEMFLSQVMGFGWEEVHDIAEELEHIKKEEFFDRMDELLGFPGIDPHGSPIPNKDGDLVRSSYESLSNFPVGSQVIFKALKDSSTEFLLFLNKRGIRLGAQIKIIDIEAFDKSMSISLDEGDAQILSHTVAMRLLVEPK